MRHSQISRNFAKAFFAFVTLGMAAACADSNVAPEATASPFKAPAGFNTTVGVVAFQVNNAEGIIQRIGNHVVYIPAGAICDPALSTYGATEWDKPCTALQGSIGITATMMTGPENEPYVDFQPALRFTPGKNVMLYLRNGRSSEPRRINMLYCNNFGFCTDESIADASLKPFRVGYTSIIGRRMKHFSGYTVNWGDPCPGTLTQEPDGTWMCYDEGGEGGMARRSGYMVASGLDDDKDSSDEEKTGVNKDDKN